MDRKRPNKGVTRSFEIEPGTIPIRSEISEFVADLFSGVRQLAFLNEDEGFECTIGGTCFTTQFRGRYFVVTAGHNLQLYDLTQVGVYLNKTTQTAIPFKEVFYPSGPRDELPECADYLIFEIDISRLSEQQTKDLRPFNLDNLPPAETLLEKTTSTLILKGYPLSLASACHESKLIRRTGYTREAKFLGPTTDPQCGLMEMPLDEQVKDPNGLSGSPVMVLKLIPSGMDYYFVGMMVRGGEGSIYGRFIYSNSILDALNRICGFSADQAQIV